MKLLFFQYGDFGEAYRRFQSSDVETYREQRASVDFVASLRDRFSVVVVAVCQREHRETLDGNLISIGIGEKSSFHRAPVNQLLDYIAPDLIVCRTPNRHVLRWAKSRGRSGAPVVCRLFSSRSIKSLLRNIEMRTILSSRVFPCVANHSLNASMSVATALWFPRSRIVPWDFKKLSVHRDAKIFPDKSARPLAFFAAPLTEVKGAGDCLRAVSILKQRGVEMSFALAGPGDLESWRARVPTNSG